jgi:hypothetical protein
MKTIQLHIKSADISEERIKELETAPFRKRLQRLSFKASCFL